MEAVHVTTTHSVSLNKAPNVITTTKSEMDR
jgi:hypothetical protein